MATVNRHGLAAVDQ